MKDFDIKYSPGFTVYRMGMGPMWVCPHSGPSFSEPYGRDSDSDTVASLCWKSTGGLLVLNNMSRSMLFGIDMNRCLPSQEKAIEMFKDFEDGNVTEQTNEYKKEFAFVAKNEYDYARRTAIYNSFWDFVTSKKGPVIFMHRQHAAFKNFPSILEIMTCRGRGIEPDVAKHAVDELNEKHAGFLAGISNHYRHTVFLQEMRFLENMRGTNNDIELSKLKANQKEYIKADLGVIKKFASAHSVDKLRENFCQRTLIDAMKDAIKAGGAPKITVDERFFGDKAMDMKSTFFEKRAIVFEAEVSSFLGYWYPEKANEMITDFLSIVKGHYTGQEHAKAANTVL